MYIIYKSKYLVEAQATLILKLSKGSSRVLQVSLDCTGLEYNEMFLRVKAKVGKTQFSIHNGLHFTRPNLVTKRFASSRDIGGKFYSSVGGAALRFVKEEQDLMLAFFSTERSNSIGYFKNGHIELGIGRHVPHNDDKGLTEGTVQEEDYQLSFDIGLFLTKEIGSDELQRYLQDELVVLYNPLQPLAAQDPQLAFGEPLLEAAANDHLVSLKKLSNGALKAKFLSTSSGSEPARVQSNRFNITRSEEASLGLTGSANDLEASLFRPEQDRFN